MSSEDELYGEARANADAGYKEMADAYAPPPKEEEKTFGDDMDSLKDVASELTGEREERHPVGILQPAIDKIVEAERKAEAELEQYYRAENDWWTPDMYSRGIDD